MPGSSLLVGVANLENSSLVPRTSPDLKAEWKAISAKTTGYAHRRCTGQVKHRREQEIVESRGSLAGERLMFLYLGGGYAQGWQHQNIICF